MSNKSYITTAIDYTNYWPHLGHALEKIQADVYARYHRMLDKEVFYLTGTDEHGAKISRAADAAGKSPREFTDEISKKFQELTKTLNISNDYFIRTSYQDLHWPAVHKLWNTIKEKGDLYKGTYRGLYCVGHEAFMKPSELKNDICPDHKTKPQVIDEENYFFRLTKYKKEIGSRIENQELRILPEHRANEVLEMLKELEDISVSRPRKDIPWGVPVPDDPEHTIYVWFEALCNYLSGIGYGLKENQKIETGIWDIEPRTWQRFWPADIHFIGKDILKFHAILWPSMLLSAGLELPHNIFVHGHITIEGEKMSKTIGNVVDPFALAEKYGVDSLRYFLLREIPSHEDGDFSIKKLEERYNADLANGLGNLIQRVAVLIEAKLGGSLTFSKQVLNDAIKKHRELKSIFSDKQIELDSAIEQFCLHDALAHIWQDISFANRYINETRPWTLKEKHPELNRVLSVATALIHHVAYWLQPFLPATSEKIFSIFGLPAVENIADGSELHISKTKAIFPRL